MDWRGKVFVMLMASLLVAECAYIGGEMYGKRVCADPENWAQESFGRAVVECEARGEGCSLMPRVYERKLVCECTKKLPVKP